MKGLQAKNSLLIVSMQSLKVGSGIKFRCDQIYQALTQKGFDQIEFATPDGYADDSYPVHSFSVEHFADLVRKYEWVYFLAINHPHLLLIAKQNQVSVLLDAYGLFSFEVLEMARLEGGIKNKISAWIYDSLFKMEFKLADYILCSNPRQLEWIKVKTKVPLEVFPYEMVPNQGSISTPELLKECDWDHLLVVGGGLWPWFDYETFFEALKQARKSNPLIKAVFLSVSNGLFPGFQQRLLARIKADEELIQGLFLNEGWMPPEQKDDVLAKAWLGINCQPDTLETHYAHRTRVADYIANQIPVLTTQGDYLAEVVAQKGFGVVVDFKDVKGWVQALLDHSKASHNYEVFKNNLKTEIPKPQTLNFSPQTASSKLSGFKRLYFAVQVLMLLVLGKLGFQGIQERSFSAKLSGENS
jgi:glycosyltransferase involved in cell wall biosynthesis